MRISQGCTNIKMKISILPSLHKSDQHLTNTVDTLRVSALFSVISITSLLNPKKEILYLFDRHWDGQA